MRPRSFFSRNICFKFSVYCLCSVTASFTSLMLVSQTFTVSASCFTKFEPPFFCTFWDQLLLLTPEPPCGWTWGGCFWALLISVPTVHSDSKSGTLWNFTPKLAYFCQFCNWEVRKYLHQHILKGTPHHQTSSNQGLLYSYLSILDS